MSSLSIAMVLLIIGMVYQLFTKNDIVNFLHLLNDFDTQAKVLEVKSNMEGVRLWIVKKMLLVALGIIAVSLGTSMVFGLKLSNSDSFLMPLSCGYLLLYLSVLIFQFSFATLAIKSRFSLLNDNLRFTYQNSSMMHSAKKYDEHLPIIITDLYSQLCDGIDLVNDSFTFQLIPFMVYYLTSNIFSIYGSIREVYYETSFKYYAFGLNIWWIIVSSGMISIVLYSASTTTRCALKTPIIVSSIVKSYRWRNSQNSQCIIDVFNTFLVETHHRNMFFESAFFRIDWKLLFSVS